MAALMTSRFGNSLEQLGAIGPGIVWNSGKWFFHANGYHELGVKNRPEGDKLVLRVEKDLLNDAAKRPLSKTAWPTSLKGMRVRIVFPVSVDGVETGSGSELR
jgi:hypothetical protein